MTSGRIYLHLFIAGCLTLSIASCDKDKTTPEDQTPPASIVGDSIITSPTPEHYTLFSLSEGKVIPITDSASGNWDFGISFITIIVNSHNETEGGIIQETGDFEAFNEAPATGYSYDTSATQLAVDSRFGSANTWYIYDPVNHVVSPKAGTFFVIKTKTGHYAKLEILNTKYGDWDGDPTHLPGQIIYPFRYLYQSDGSTSLQ